jgi:hypothetical protein
MHCILLLLPIIGLGSFFFLCERSLVVAVRLIRISFSLKERISIVFQFRPSKMFRAHVNTVWHRPKLCLL